MLYLIITCRMLLIGVFVIALAGKVRGRAAFDGFVASIVSLRVLPGAWSAVAAHVLVGAEAAVVVLLALPSTVPLGFVTATGMLVVMTAGILIALRRGQRTPCRCFGASAKPLGRVHVVRNIALAVAGGAGFTAGGVVGGAGSSPHPAGIALALVTAAVGILFVTRLDDLMELFAAPLSPRRPAGSAGPKS
ncbi:MauE/DoxX family redox-associated membrane protein [Streptosporangium lutulentum]|uniref:Methylamine utilisation protein MauE domain-containing protein n=1 Tax=Streptosporangium lutulentum TaxID=1461250 RepID=A0ABT9QBB2_9ACTN|nr:MauE/DoxX family redox-associated membrane protein [Streptosporangium lutulentum]MDP9844058.1 hypothetical protein [Streptosporangium lutulentum]